MLKKFKISPSQYIAISTFLVRAYCVLAIINAALHPHRFISNEHYIYHLLVIITIMFLTTKLRKGYLLAWYTIISLLILLDLSHFWQILHGHKNNILYIIITTLIIILLAINKSAYTIKHSFFAFRQSLISVILIALLVLTYGTVGFLHFDEAVFGKELNTKEAIIQTFKEINPNSTDLNVYSKTGEKFIDSLPILWFLVLAYGLFSLYQPAKFKYIYSVKDKRKADDIWAKYSNNTEDWFKIWPDNLHYYFYEESFIAYRVHKNTAIAIGDPVGKTTDRKLCIVNWLDTIHEQGWAAGAASISSKTTSYYRECGLNTLGIGGEAYVDINKFCDTTIKSSHFRNIINRAKKTHYQFSIINAPYSQETMQIFREISDEWLKKGGRKERQFGLGYFEPSYLNKCNIAIVKNEQSKIIAYANIIPTSKNNPNASIDLMRYSSDADRTVMHYLLAELIIELSKNNTKKFNLGLIPLAKDSLVSHERLKENLLILFRSIGNKYFSFSGLEQFKNKFEPELVNRYIAYEPSKLPSFLIALEKLMKI